MEEERSSRKCEFKIVEKALLIWFYQQRDLGNPISRLIIQQFVIQLYQEARK